MKTIYKYPIEFIDIQQVPLPVGATILTVQIKGDQLCLWAMVDTEQTGTQSHTIRVAGTGHPLNECINYHYISTVQLDGGLIFHILEIT